MYGTPGDVFEHERLQAIYEARSLLIIGFVLANLVALQLLRLGFETLASVIVAVAAAPLVIVAVGLLRETSRWIGSHRPVG
ncbi:hypothetical protein [Halapricum desulfuricans]|uniref:Uncharacterized protein n=1 Tax=Halapricum desulfuricans TaxID=2841257 RepID=A0A897NFT5_9EURY|nr:hypothetical protein [Halapricum desulfuricans]QSG08620.1 hypothetical protein HSR122_1222 [Halapricum desulfuricans]QSG11572.1 hypothetical protein HSBGL_1148 [Halapricum desulfuricans]